MILKYIKILIVVMGLSICAVGWAGDETVSDDKPAQPKVKGLDLATDVVGDVGNKAVALLNGNLSVDMKIGKDPALKKDDYTYNAIGQRIPKATATKTGRACHNQ